MLGTCDGLLRDCSQLRESLEELIRNSKSVGEGEVRKKKSLGTKGTKEPVCVQQHVLLPKVLPF